MKKMLLFDLCCLLFSSCAFFLQHNKTVAQKPLAAMVIVKGKVTHTASYCGGVRPSQEMLNELATPKPFAGKNLFLISGNKNSVNRTIILKIKSDSLGDFSFNVSPGVYSIILEEQLDFVESKKYQNKYQIIDDTCYKDWWQQPYYLLEIKENEQVHEQLNFNFYHRCFLNTDIPCIQYTGPMPP